MYICTCMCTCVLLNLPPGSLCAIEGEDFATLLTFAAGEREKCVTVPIVVDTGVDMTSINLMLLDQPEGRIQLSPSVAIIEIVGE